LGSVMPLTLNGEDTDEQPRLTDEFLNPRILRHAHQ